MLVDAAFEATSVETPGRRSRQGWPRPSRRGGRARSALRREGADRRYGREGQGGGPEEGPGATVLRVETDADHGSPYEATSASPTGPRSRSSSTRTSRRRPSTSGATRSAHEQRRGARPRLRPGSRSFPHAREAPRIGRRADVAQLAERRLPKPKVAGSTPVVRLSRRPCKYGHCTLRSNATSADPRPLAPPSACDLDDRRTKLYNQLAAEDLREAGRAAHWARGCRHAVRQGRRRGAACCRHERESPSSSNRGTVARRCRHATATRQRPHPTGGPRRHQARGPAWFAEKSRSPHCGAPVAMAQSLTKLVALAGVPRLGVLRKQVDARAVRDARVVGNPMGEASKSCSLGHRLVEPAEAFAARRGRCASGRARPSGSRSRLSRVLL